MLKRYLVMGLFGVLAASSYCVAAEPGWTKDSNNGCKVFNPAPEPGDSVTWSGSCKGGYASGSGTLQWSSNGSEGGKYEGEMIGGKRHGTGTYKWKDGRSYEGGWANDKFNGPGMQFENDGTVFAVMAVNGEFKLSMKTRKDSNGCNVNYMGFSGHTFTYTWHGKCENGFTQGNGELQIEDECHRYDDNNLLYKTKCTEAIYYGNMEHGFFTERIGEATRRRGVLNMNPTEYYYFYYGKLYSDYNEYQKAKDEIIGHIKFYNSLYENPERMLTAAIKEEASDREQAINKYSQIINNLPNTEYSNKATYRKSFLEASSSSELENFIKTYAKKDPGKLVPKAKVKLTAALKREAAERAEAERREQHRREHACDHLYAGKPVTVHYTHNGFFGSSNNYAKAVIVGISNAQGIASAKIIGGDAYEMYGYGIGTIIERSCSSF